MENKRICLHGHLQCTDYRQRPFLKSWQLSINNTWGAGIGKLLSYQAAATGGTFSLGGCPVGNACADLGGQLDGA